MGLVYALLVVVGVGLLLLLLGRVIPGLVLWGCAYALERHLSTTERRKAT